MSRERPEPAPPHEGRGRRRRSIVAVAASRDTYPGPASLARLSGRIGLASFTVLLAVGVASRLGPDPLIAVLGAATALAGAVPLFLLRPRFVIAYAVVATVGVGLIENAAPGGVGWFAVVVLAAWCVLAGGVRVGLLYGTGALLLFGAEWLWAFRDPGWGPWTAGVTFTVLAMTLVRHEFVLIERLRAAQADLEARSRAEERTRIARELHDVIAHGLTVSLLHLSSARLAVEHDDPADAARALAEAERVSRQSLAEVRATMGVLHADPTRGITPPVPGVDQLPQLVEQLRDVGAAVSLAVTGGVDDVPATTGSTIYRIAQEALTNATRHAPGSAVAVRLETSADRLEISIDSAGAPGHGSGLGLMSMRARAESVGGTCTAGPGGRGWLVHACLPLPDRARR